MKVRYLIPPSERRRRGLIAFLLFLLGVFAETKIYFYGCIALSELVVFALVPPLLVEALFPYLFRVHWFAVPMLFFMRVISSIQIRLNRSVWSVANVPTVRDVLQ